MLVNGGTVKSNYRVKPLDVITVVLPYPHYEYELIPEDIPLDILYEDEQLLVVNKKAGMVVHPGHGNYTGTLVNALAWHLRDQPLFQTGEMRPGLVHRIDKDTSGLLVIAKTEISLAKLARQFFDRTTSRTYQAVVWGTFDPPEGTITGNIGRNLRDRLKMHVFPEGDQGKPAITHYRELEKLGYVSLVECRLETGRTHQIRAHMEYVRHPIFNDERTAETKSSGEPFLINTGSLWKIASRKCHGMPCMQKHWASGIRKPKRKCPSIRIFRPICRICFSDGETIRIAGKNRLMRARKINLDGPKFYHGGRWDFCV